jgi:hypothetical protein
MRKIKKEAIRVHIMSMEAACSDSVLMGFPASFPSRARDPPGNIRKKKKRRRRGKILGLRKNLIFLPDSKILPGLSRY